MENMLNQLHMPAELQEQIFNLIVEEASSLMEVFFTPEEIETYAKASDLILSIPQEKMVALQNQLGPKLTTKIEELMRD
tara:strand:- start:35 stop:271 length:237 start_codon:yes stop_codon:yes gene_type:complete